MATKSGNGEGMINKNRTLKRWVINNLFHEKDEKKRNILATEKYNALHTDQQRLTLLKLIKRYGLNVDIVDYNIKRYDMKALASL